MKILFCLLAGTVLTSFTNKSFDNDLDGYWMGYYRSDFTKEKVIVKLNADDRMDFYTGGELMIVPDWKAHTGYMEILFRSVIQLPREKKL